MKNTRGDRPLSRIAKIAGLAVGLLLALLVVDLSVASWHGSDPSDFAAADFSSRSAAAAIAAGEQRLTNNDPDGAAVFAKQALSISPISADALRTAAIAEQARGHPRFAAALLSQASALGWRDLPTQIWLAHAQLASGNYPAAAERLDAALRLKTNSTPLFDIVDGILAGTPAVPAFVRRMALDPDWRAAYLSYVTNANFPLRVEMARGLAALHSPPERKAMRLIINPFMKQGRIGEARALWFQTEGGAPGALNDPQFRHVSSSGSGPFEWSLLPVIGASALPDPGGLQATTDGQAAGVLANQIVLLAPGQHRIAFRGALPSAPQPFHWRILCMPRGKMLVDQADVPGKVYSFIVPPGECAYQTVELAVASGDGGSNRQALFSVVNLQ